MPSTTESELKMWKEYALELECRLEEVLSQRKRSIPSMEGQRLVREERYPDE